MSTWIAEYETEQDRARIRERERRRTAGKIVARDIGIERPSRPQALVMYALVEVRRAGRRGVLGSIPEVEVGGRKWRTILDALAAEGLIVGRAGRWVACPPRPDEAARVCSAAEHYLAWYGTDNSDRSRSGVRDGR